MKQRMKQRKIAVVNHEAWLANREIAHYCWTTQVTRKIQYFEVEKYALDVFAEELLPELPDQNPEASPSNPFRKKHTRFCSGK